MGQSAIDSRYPQLAFLIRLLLREPFEPCLTEDGMLNGQRGDFRLHQNTQKERQRFDQETNLDQVNAVYIYGLGLGYHYTYLKQWLEEDTTRDLIFIEEDPAVLSLFMSKDELQDIFLHPQVHLRWMFDQERRDAFYQECANSFPVRRVAVAALESYAKKYTEKYEELKLALMRTSTVENALFMENLYYHQLFTNLLPNYRRLPKAFYGNGLHGQFKNIPAIICGAGPSLSEAIPFLKNMEQKALIIAGGSTITALSSQGVSSHFHFAIDPNPTEYSRIHPSQSYETPLCYGNRLREDVFNTFNGPIGYLHTCTGGYSEIWMEQELGLESEDVSKGWSDEALSVTTLSISTVVKFECNPIILVGLDLAFTNMQSYSEGVLDISQVFFDEMKQDTRSSEKLLTRTDRDGNHVYTLIKWVMESAAISGFVKANPETKFINATNGGIGFEGIPYIPIEEVANQLKNSYDIRGLVHANVQESLLCNLSDEQVEASIEKLRLSIEKCYAVIGQALDELKRISEMGSNIENGRMLLFQMELHEELAYKVLLFGLDHALDFSMKCRHRSNSWKAQFDKTLSKWKHLRCATSSYLRTIHSPTDKVGFLRNLREL